jgi:DNA primase large subunit
MEVRVWAAARSQGRARAQAAVEGEPVPPTQAASDHQALVAVLGYAVARLLVSLVDDKMLTNRYATSEARRLQENLGADDEKVLLHVAEALGVPATPVDERVYAVPFTDFLSASKDLRALEWKLVNQDLQDGQVLLPRVKLARLVQEAYKLKLLDELPLRVPPVVAEHLDTWARELDAQIQEVRSEQVDLAAAEVHPQAFPPCIRNLISAIKASENVSHEGRFATVTFLNHVGMDRDAIIQDLFSNVPDFARDITEYQVDHILGNKTKGEAYTPPGCGSLQTYGLCPMMAKPKDDWHKWCAHEKMNHPLTFYRWGLFVEEKKAEEASSEAGQADEQGAKDDQGDEARGTEDGAGGTGQPDA